jgi:hypothetical protein
MLQVGALMHLDIVFPSIRGVNGEQCVLTTLDDASSYACVYPLASKGQAADAILQRIALLDRQMKPICRIHCDRGGEFSGTAFLDTLKVKGIVVEFSPAGQPKCNAKIERFHGIITPRVRAVLAHRRLPCNLWPALIDGVTYVYNRTPSHAIEGRIPFEVWANNPVPTLRHLRALGCPCYYKIPHPEGKLAPRAKPAIFVGYASDGRGRTAVYRVWDTTMRRIIESADVDFDERPPEEPTQEPNRDQIVFDSAMDNSQDVDDPSAQTLQAVQPQGEIQPDDDVEPAQPIDGSLQALPVVQTDNIPDNSVPCEEDQTTTNWRSTRAKGQPDRWTYAAEAHMALRPELSKNDVREIASYLGAAGEGLREDQETLTIRTELPIKYGEALNASNEKLLAPRSLDEALKHPYSERWLEAMREEIAGAIAKDVFELAELPRGARRIGSMWVYSYKLNEDGSIASYKARLVARGFSQKLGIDYHEVWAPTGKMSTLRALLVIAAQRGYELWQIDITKAFLNGDLEPHEEVYVSQPPGFEDSSGRVWRLKKSLYGLKQAARAWHKKLLHALKDLDYGPSYSDPALFVHKLDRDGRFAFTWVDDLVGAGTPGNARQDMQKLLVKYQGKELGEPRNLLGLFLARDLAAKTISISQPLLIEQILQRFQMECAPNRSTPLTGTTITKESKLPALSDESKQQYAAIVGSLMYLATTTRPDLSFTGSQLARYMTNPTMEHLTEAKNSLQYLGSTRHLKLVLGKHNKENKMANPAVMFSDADFANCVDTRRSITGFLLTLYGSPVLWGSRRQPIVTKSTMAAEYVAASQATDEVLHFMKLEKDLGIEQDCIPMLLKQDNQATARSLVNPIEDGKSKYLDIHFHYVRERIQKGEIVVEWVDTNSMLADAFTKPLGPLKLKKFCSDIGLV